MNMRYLVAILIVVIVVESSVLAFLGLTSLNPRQSAYLRSYSQSASFSYSIFNQPISNDTQYTLSPSLPGSWEVDVQSSLIPASNVWANEAQVALAPAYDNENRSIPTLIIQERSDGLLRVEYYAQNWPNTYGLVLYNSTSPSWIGQNVTLAFQSTGPPSQVDPQTAPRPNGNLDISIAGTTVVSAFPIAWANLSDLYLYGYPGSAFTGGSVQVSLYQL